MVRFRGYGAVCFTNWWLFSQGQCILCSSSVLWARVYDADCDCDSVLLILTGISILSLKDQVRRTAYGSFICNSRLHRPSGTQQHPCPHRHVRLPCSRFFLSAHLCQARVHLLIPLYLQSPECFAVEQVTRFIIRFFQSSDVDVLKQPHRGQRWCPRQIAEQGCRR